MKFCPHDLFVNTRADLGVCARVHDDEARDLFEKATPSYRKTQYEDEFIRFCQGMLNEVERKIVKGKQRLALIGKTEAVIAPSIRPKFCSFFTCVVGNFVILSHVIHQVLSICFSAYFNASSNPEK